VRTLTVVALIALLSLSSAAVAKHRRAIEHPRQPGMALTATPNLTAEAARMAAKRQWWLNQPLVDEGGYRIRPKIGQ
jgi:hypothetical protein